MNFLVLPTSTPAAFPMPPWCVMDEDTTAAVAHSEGVGESSPPVAAAADATAADSPPPPPPPLPAPPPTPPPPHCGSGGEDEDEERHPPPPPSALLEPLIPATKTDAGQCGGDGDACNLLKLHIYATYLNYAGGEKIFFLSVSKCQRLSG